MMRLYWTFKMIRDVIVFGFVNRSFAMSFSLLAFLVIGLAIVAAIANRIGSSLFLKSPRPGESSGFQASLRLPTDVTIRSERFDA